MRTSERGFTLLELIVALAIVTVAVAAGAGAVASVARNALSGTVRDAALMAADNALARARAAAAYVPPGAASPAAAAADLAWALAPQSSYSAGVRIEGLCGEPSRVLRLPVQTLFDAATSRFTVTVLYPRDPCASGSPQTQAVLSVVVPPAVYPPGTVLRHAIAPPARM